MNCNYLRKTHKCFKHFDESVESKYFIWFVGMIITPFLFLTYWNSTNSGAQYYPNHSSNTSGTREREVWKGTLMVADLEQVEKNRRVRIPQRKAQREGGDLDQNWWQFQKPQMDNLQFIGGDQVLRTPTLTRYHPSSRRSSRRPSWRIRRVSTTNQSKRSLHINTVCTEISDILTKIASKQILGKLVMNLFNKQTYAVYYR